MNLIDNIEIGYFRSIYKERLLNLSDLTILFGRNDSGKSNFLRALNLFFNQQTNPDIAFDFDRDLCQARRIESEDRPGARRFVYVKLMFNTPSSYQKSLGTSFYVKKQWSVTKQSEPHLETSVPDGSRHYLSRFLNQIRFHYVPAIKDRRIFETLLARVYGVLSQQEQFLSSLDGFSRELRDQTADLSDGLKEALNLESAIAPPADLTDLFRSLDFETKGNYGDSYSLTLQRGDGVQVRHIPAILSFLSDRSAQDYHIWGFEEPENSLELANAIEEAELFRHYGISNNKQIFLTSHSAAFFSLNEPNVRRFFVSKKQRDVPSETSAVKSIKGLKPDELPGELMGETPHLAVISHHLREADERIKSLRSESDRLAQEVKDAHKPILFVEGDSDKNIVVAAWNAFEEGTLPFEVVACEGTSKMEALAKDGKPLDRLNPGRKIFVLVDNDREGRGLWKEKRLKPGAKWVQHNSNKTYWCRLPQTLEFTNAMKAFGLDESRWPAALENCFDRKIRLAAQDEGAYAMTSSPYDEIREDAASYSKVQEVLHADSPQNNWKLYVTKPHEQCKIPFSEWVVMRASTSPDVLTPFASIVRGIRELLETVQAP